MSTTEDELFALSVIYATAADGRDPAAFLGAFTDDARLRVSAPGAPGRIVRTYSGAGELAQVPVRLGRYQRTSHVVGPADLRVDGRGATGEVHCVAHHVEQGPTGWTDKVMTIRYADVYRLTEAGWRIAERTVQVDGTETRPAAAPEP
ncbi:MAG TPA: nuclear transport factor 2 family protein [Iamia sp.]